MEEENDYRRDGEEETQRARRRLLVFFDGRAIPLRQRTLYANREIHRANIARWSRVGVPGRFRAADTAFISL